MKIILAGGTGLLGQIIIRALSGKYEFVVLSRPAPPSLNTSSLAKVRVVRWDAAKLGDWTQELEGAEAVINLAGRSVDCRYTAANLSAMKSSRINSTRVLGEALALAKYPPRVWLQMSTATIYAHRFDAANDEGTGLIGGSEPDAPAHWAGSIKIAREWEDALFSAPTPNTRKVALRSAMVMSQGHSGVFDAFASLARRGLGGPHGSGRQFVSWIHEEDFASAIQFLVERENVAGAVNICSPHPLPNQDFQAELRRVLGVRIALPSPAWLLELGAFFLRTETELLLKSRRVVPGRLMKEGFSFRYPMWSDAALDLTKRWRAKVA